MPVMAQQAEEVWQTDGFAMPESVLWDADTGLFYVSNMGADPMANVGDGFIATIDASGMVRNMAFATGLDAPKGMAVADGMLFFSDIDSVKAITPEGRIVALTWSPMQ